LLDVVNTTASSVENVYVDDPTRVVKEVNFGTATDDTVVPGVMSTVIFAFEETKERGR
jgi:hypothetical protein